MNQNKLKVKQICLSYMKEKIIVDIIRNKKDPETVNAVLFPNVAHNTKPLFSLFIAV